jgi:hypothetical protein
MSRSAENVKSLERVPSAETPSSRSAEQEVAAGRTAATPAVALGSVIAVVAAAFLLVLAIVVVAFVLS